MYWARQLGVSDAIRYVGQKRGLLAGLRGKIGRRARRMVDRAILDKVCDIAKLSVRQALHDGAVETAAP